MNQYITGNMIKELRQNKSLTQKELAELLDVSDKTISKWETGRGYPDVTLLEPLAQALNVSVAELLAGENCVNNNRSANMLKTLFYVCPVCGNVIHSTGEAFITCCGITLPPLEEEDCDENHELLVEIVEDEYYVTTNHPMTKTHHFSFVAALSDNGIQLIKLYPEGTFEARFKIARTKALYYYCNKHGFFKKKVTPPKAPKRNRLV